MGKHVKDIKINYLKKRLYVLANISATKCFFLRHPLFVAQYPLNVPLKFGFLSADLIDKNFA